MCLSAERGYNGEVGTGFRSKFQPFDSGPFLLACDAFLGLNLDSDQILAGDFEMTMGQLGFVSYKVCLRC